MQHVLNRRSLVFTLVGVLVAALIGVMPIADAQPANAPAQNVTVTNTPLPVQGAVTVANTTPLTVHGSDTEVIIDEFKDLDLSYSPYVYTFGVHDLSAYKQIRIMVVGDCVFEPPYNCADNPHDKVDLEVRALIGHPDSQHTIHNWQLWRAFHWMTDLDKGMLGTDTLDIPGGLVEFRVHYYSGPVHLRVLGRRN